MPETSPVRVSPERTRAYESGWAWCGVTSEPNRRKVRLTCGSSLCPVSFLRGVPSMRAVGPMVVVFWGLIIWVTPFVHTQAADAASVLAAARDALGGDKRIEAVRTLIANG